MKFKVKRRWWMWAIWALWHLFASLFLRIGIWQVIAVVIIIDFIIIFPDASHFYYDITKRQFTVERLIYSDISFPCEEIIAVQEVSLFTYRTFQHTATDLKSGFGLKIYSEPMSSYKITYMKNSYKRRQKSVFVCPQNREEFMRELSLNVDKSVILIGNTESAFKKKKDEM